LNDKLKSILKDAVEDYFEVRPAVLVFARGLRKTAKNLSEQTFSEPRFEPGDSRIRSWNATYATTTFDAIIVSNPI